MKQTLADIEVPSVKDFIFNLLPDPTTRFLTGIYKLYFLNDIKNRVYIGSATQTKIHDRGKLRKGFYSRFYYHIYQLRTKTHGNPKLQRYVNKYGLSKISIDILELCAVDIAKEREEYYIKCYDAVKTGFNCSHDGHTNGAPLSIETRALISKKVSAKLKGKIPKNWKSIEGMRAKPVLEFENNILIKEYKSLTEMCKMNNFPYKFFSQVLCGKAKIPEKFFTQNKHWTYK